MEPVVNKAKNHQDARLWDILQHIALSSEQRQDIARELKRKAYGENVPDVRQYHGRQ